jgi:hypothetical protein
MASEEAIRSPFIYTGCRWSIELVRLVGISGTRTDPDAVVI